MVVSLSRLCGTFLDGDVITRYRRTQERHIDLLRKAIKLPLIIPPGCDHQPLRIRTADAKRNGHPGIVLYQDIDAVVVVARHHYLKPEQLRIDDVARR